MVWRFCRALLLVGCLLEPGATAWAGSSTGLFPDPLPAHYRTGRNFTTALEQSISGSWKGVPLRSVLRRLSHEREVSILLDRRVDPDQDVKVETVDQPFRAVINEIAQATQLGVTQVGNCLVIAPATPILRLRTLVALRDMELAKRSASFEGASQLRTQKATIAWDDLERPADIVAGIGRQFGLSIVGLELIPHDLWAGATIPEATAPEALSLVLNQFDLTFEWLPRESGVRLVQAPAHPTIERSYSLRGKRAPQTIRILHSLIDGLDAQTRGNRLVVRGTVEQHEIVESVIRGANGSLQAKSKQTPVPIEKQSFMLQAGGVSLQELLIELKKQGLPLEYDAAVLKRAGVDLRRKVDVDLPRLPAAQFLARLLEPYGLTFRFEHGAVLVFPK
ncbi:MAG TPA: STN domain-containing protein [Planctomycetaceae bacterium]|nr:STN domain-containing protein [Planctomycetaceae bacterium]